MSEPSSAPIIIAALVGFAAASVIFFKIGAARARDAAAKGPEVHVHASIESLRSVGELVVMKIVTKEIVTAADHWLGESGKKYFSWLVSTKKMAMIFEFGIDFRFDLQSPEFGIEQTGEGRYRLAMPRCMYETHIRDISFYDEQSARLLPWLLPDLINRAFGPAFDEADKNRLKQEAMDQATRMAQDLVDRMGGEVQRSARQTLEALARGFGVSHVEIDFGKAEIVQVGIDANGIGGANHRNAKKLDAPAGEGSDAKTA